MSIPLPSPEEFRKALDAMPKEELNEILNNMASEIKENETRKPSAKDDFHIIIDLDDL